MFLEYNAKIMFQGVISLFVQKYKMDLILNYIYKNVYTGIILHYFDFVNKKMKKLLLHSFSAGGVAHRSRGHFIQLWFLIFSSFQLCHLVVIPINVEAFAVVPHPYVEEDSYYLQTDGGVRQQVPDLDGVVYQTVQVLWKNY